MNRKRLCAAAGSACVTDPGAAGSDTERVRVTVPLGYADITAVKIRPATGTTTGTQSIWFIRSRGKDTSRARLAGAAGDTAVRIVGQYAWWNTATVNVMSAWTSISGMNKNGTSGVASGVDGCGQSTSLPGVTVPVGSYSGSTSWLAGSPPLDTSRTYAQLKNTIGVDWPGVQSGSIEADYEIPSASFPSLSWFTANPDAWPVIRIHTNNYSLPNKGRGMIIADSNFVISGSDMWEGVMLIGGKLTSNGNNTVNGATITGLNRITGGTVDESEVLESGAGNDVGNGNKTFSYNSCNVAAAAAGLRAFRAIPNSWMDNLPAW